MKAKKVHAKATFWSEFPVPSKKALRPSLRQFVEKDHLIPKHTPTVRNLALLHHRIVGVVLQPGDEINPPASSLPTSGSPHTHGRAPASFRPGSAESHVLALGDHRKAGQRAFVVQQQMQFHCRFGAAEVRPIENRGAQVILVASKLIGLFLKRSFLLLSLRWAATAWHWSKS